MAIVRAIVVEPTLLLADEPTANVDHDLKTTFLFSTHDPRVMERAHRLIWMRGASVERDGSLAALARRSRPRPPAHPDRVFGGIVGAGADARHDGRPRSEYGEAPATIYGAVKVYF